MKSAVQIDVTMSPMGNIPRVCPGITKAACTGAGAGVAAAGAGVTAATFCWVKMAYDAAGSGELILATSMLPLAVIPKRLIVGRSAACTIVLR